MVRPIVYPTCTQPSMWKLWTRSFALEAEMAIVSINDITCLQVSTMTWEPLEPKGALPGPRANHSSCIIGSSYFVMGGWNDDTRFSDISILHFSGKKQATWSTVQDEFGPPPRVGPGLAEFHGKVVLYGGFFEGGLKDIHVFDPATKHWTKVHERKGLFQRQEIEYTGAQVARRVGHTMNQCRWEHACSLWWNW